MTEVSVPYTFVPGTKAKAEEVNANFNALKEAIGAKADKSGDVNQPLSVADATENSHAVNKGQFDKSQGELLEKSNMNRSNFCVKSANLTNGVADLLTYSTMTVSFKVGGSYSDLVTGHLDGKTVTRTELNPIDMSGKAEGTYNVFVPIEGDACVLKNAIYRQANAPTMLENDIWLDLSSEPLSAKKYNGSALDVFNDVPLGKVVVKNGAIASVETFAYNQNGYDLNSLSNDWRKAMPNYGKGTWKALNTPHQATCDGWVYAYCTTIREDSPYLYLSMDGQNWTPVDWAGVIPNSYANMSGIIIPMSKGTWYQVLTDSLIFYPCIGSN